MTQADRKIHIWAITNLYPPNMTGSGIQAHQMLRELVRRGFKATILTSSNLAAEHLRGQRLTSDGIQVRYLRSLQHSSWASVSGVRKVRKVVPFIKALMGSLSFGFLAAWTVLREGDPGDIVRVYSPDEFTFLSVWAARLRGMSPVLDMTLLGSDDPMAIRKQWNKILGQLTMESFRRAEAITGHSSAQIQSYISAGLDPRRVFHIPYGVDIRSFRPVNNAKRNLIRKELGLALDGRLIVFVGDAIERKGLDVVFEAFLQVHSQYPDTELLIVGPHDFEDRAYKLARDLRANLAATTVSTSVHWVGMVDNVNEYMQAADLFCLPTRREGFGIVIIEAMAAGLPVIVSRLEGVTTDIVKSSQEGVLIEGHNPDHFAKALVRLLSDPAKAKKIGNAERDRVVRDFSLERIAGLYVDLYRQLSRETPKPETKVEIA